MTQYFITSTIYEALDGAWQRLDDKRMKNGEKPSELKQKIAGEHSSALAEDFEDWFNESGDEWS